jgi:hypothetical protein
MTRFLLILLLLGSPAMAKDGSYSPPNPAAPIDQEEAFWNSEEGQDITRMFEEFSSGRRTYEEVFEEYNKKWADKPLPQPPSQVPNAPFPPLR